MIKQICAIFVGLCLFSCSRYEQPLNNLELHDSLFKLKNINSTRLSEKEEEMAFAEMNEQQKQFLMVPIMTKELKVDSTYVIRFMNCKFISKQDLTDGYTGFIAQVNGDDYEARFYILLNNNNQMTSYFRLSGGFCGGPGESEKGFTKLCPVRYSQINQSEITTYVITEMLSNNPNGKKTITDSVTYKSIISSDGKINTVRTDSIRQTKDSQ